MAVHHGPAEVHSWLDARPNGWQAQVVTVALDPWRGDANALGTQEAARGLIGNSDASGHLGRRVAERLARQGIRQRLLVQDRSPAPELPDSEVATISGYGDAESMPKALAGVETLLVIPVKEQPDRVRLHQAAVDAAVAAGVRRVVYSSFLGAAADVTFTFARDHFAAEEHIRSTGVAFTFLRGSAFLEVIHWLIGADGAIRGPPGSQARLHARHTVLATRSRYGTCHRRPAGGAGLAQASLALCRASVCGPDLDRADGRHPASGGADRAGPGRGVPAGRQGRPRGGGGGPGSGGWLGDGDAGGDRSQRPVGGRSGPPGRCRCAGAGRDQLPQGHPPGADPVRHRTGGPGWTPSTPPTGAPTDRPRPSTCSSRRSSASATASATSPTTGYARYCTAASRGRLTKPQACEAAHHAWWRRA
jgi:hypothetical protein